MIRLTTSRYYTPSGRCIQKPYEKGKGDEYQLDLLNRYNSGELWHVDSIKLDTTQVYHTLRNGRTVYGGGGIMPDVFVPVDTSSYTPYYRDLVAKGAIMKYVIANIEANRKALLRTYPNEEIFAKKYVPTDEDVKQIIDRGTQAGVAYNEEQWTTSRDLILAVYKGLMTRDLYEKGIYVRSTNPLNADFNAAVDLIRDAARYNALLKGK
jgi:carboxyl-terminal processing protease